MGGTNKLRAKVFSEEKCGRLEVDFVLFQFVCYLFLFILMNKLSVCSLL